MTRLAESMAKIGLQTPITVRVDGDDLLLVAGLHRLEAALRLGWDKIDAIYLDGDATDARLWEIAENLHRADLSAVERNEHVAEWVKLTAEKVGHSAPPLGGSQPREQGIRKAAEDLGIERTQVRRSVKIAALPEETRDQAREEGWSQTRLLAAAAPSKPVPLPKNEIETEEDWRNGMMRLWNRAPDDWRERFLDYVQQPVFDNTGTGR